MKLREELEIEEIKTLCEFAAKSKYSKGRVEAEEADDFRTCFQRDRDRIIHSKALRRLMHKTQVFIAPEGDHYRTRLTHTLEVSQIARTIAKALNLNEDLTEAIAMGHDLGHTPFGHMGEFYLNKIYPGGFRHNEQSLRVVDILEKDYKGKTLNLTSEVRDGIRNHSGDTMPFTLEGQIVRLSDRIAYINHDIDDAIRAGVIRIEDIPGDFLSGIGSNHGDRIAYLVKDIIINSDGKDKIVQSELASELMNGLRSWMFDNVYRNPAVRKKEDEEMAETIICSLYEYFKLHPAELPDEEAGIAEKEGIETAVKDYIAGMTDRYAKNIYQNIYKKV